MIVFGIPTYNESKNISSLVHKIDRLACKLNKKIIIINSDNNSPDGTYRIFRQLKITNSKISLVTQKKGKGYNIRAIFNEILKMRKCEGCILIDGDIKSFSEEWFVKYIRALEEGNDFIVPVYSRKYNEGNTTNHFIYPLLYKDFREKALKQGIAGDFAFSIKYIKFIMSNVNWHKYSLGYGVDIFLTLNSIYNNFKIKEIILDKKIHSPSFFKMYEMFKEVSLSYFKTMDSMNKLIINKYNINTIVDYNKTLLNSRKIILEQDIKKLFSVVKTDMLDRSFIRNPSANNWINLLLNISDKKISPEEKSAFITPYFIVRVCYYLTNIRDAKKASEELKTYENIIDERSFCNEKN